MRVPSGRMIISIIFTLLIMLNANSATSSAQPSNRLPTNQEITKT